MKKRSIQNKLVSLRNEMGHDIIVKLLVRKNSFRIKEVYPDELYEEFSENGYEDYDNTNLNKKLRKKLSAPLTYIG